MTWKKIISQKPLDDDDDDLKKLFWGLFGKDIIKQHKEKWKALDKAEE